MYTRNLKIIGGIAVIVLIVILSIAIKKRQEYNFEFTAERMLETLKDKKHLMSPFMLQESLNNNEDIVIVDVRDPHQYNHDKIQTAVNIPLHTIFDESYEDFFESDKKKVLYCNGCVKSNEACILLTQYGYNNIYVLEGGIDIWKKNISDGIQSDLKNYKDESPQLDYSELTKTAGNDSLQKQSSETQKKIDPIKKVKKKTIEGGCS
ncbi:MAG: rhodanese-like domain-containing protein [Bacteroidetes bacterium]|nr:rhodanese-like domain-containing protein [Bacteroidota bacterium]